MPHIIMSSGANKLDGSVRGLAFGFLSKLAEDDTLPGLHIEPIHNVRDPRVRTGRVNDNYRAVLFKLAGSEDEASYVYVGIWPHDEAIARAQSATLAINPVNGIPEITSTPVAEPVTERTIAGPQVGEHAELGAAPPEPLLPSMGISREDLVSCLGLDEYVSELALSATSATELSTLADEAVAWQGLALIELTAGYTIDEVQERLELLEPDEVSGGVRDATDDEILEAIRRPAAQLQFAFIEDNDELRHVIDSGDFGAWRTFLHPEQRRYVSARYNGAFRLSGGAGTGKTVVLIHRARSLIEQEPDASVLLTTFSTTLADALRSGLRELDPDIALADAPGEPGIYVAGVDAMAKQVLDGTSDEQRRRAVEAVLGARAGDIAAMTSNESWRDVAQSAISDLGSTLATPTFLQAEYTMVVLPHRITNRDEYVTVRRPGRGVALNRAKRDAVWRAVETYRASAAVEGSTDWPERAAIAAAILEESGAVFDHVLVDEGQDLNPSQWQLLRALVPFRPNDLFIAEDSHQRIYGQQVVLGWYGIGIVGRSRRLTLNYRTTAENLAYAVGVLSGADFFDVEGESETTGHYRSARRGPAPQLIGASSVGDELDKAREIIAAWLERRAPETIGVLVRSRSKASQVVTGLSERGVEVRHVEGKSVPPGKPVVMTMHRAKGMEFEAVLIFGVSDRELPASYIARQLDEAEREDFFRRERSLLYVASTRARDELVILWDGKPSALLPR